MIIINFLGLPLSNWQTFQWKCLHCQSLHRHHSCTLGKDMGGHKALVIFGKYQPQIQSTNLSSSSSLSSPAPWGRTWGARSTSCSGRAPASSRSAPRQGRPSPSPGRCDDVVGGGKCDRYPFGHYCHHCNCQISPRVSGHPSSIIIHIPYGHHFHHQYPSDHQ